MAAKNGKGKGKAAVKSKAYPCPLAAVDDPDEGWADSRTPRQQWVDFALLSLCNIAWTIDAGILPIFFKELQVHFHVSQTALSLLSTTKGWAAALCALPCGFAGEMFPRPMLICSGMLIWSAGLGVCAFANSFATIFVARLVNGMGLGVVQPLLFSLVADKKRPSRRGSAFGVLYFVGCVGNMLFTFVATSSAADYIGGVAGWRLSVGLVALFSAAVGVLVLLFVSEPNTAALMRERRNVCATLKASAPKVLQLFRQPSFVLILLQGGPGSTPWMVFPLFTQWLELSCFTHGETAWIMFAFLCGNAASFLLSGALLDLTAGRCPDHGPPAIVNFSVAYGIPFLALFFFLLPKPAALGTGAQELPIYWVSFFLFTLGSGMCAPVNKKIFSDIVPASLFTYIFAIDQLIENGVANLAGLAAGVITDTVFSYDAASVSAGDCAPSEAQKLGSGMFAISIPAWLICFSVYLGLHVTYPRDRRRQLMEPARKAEQEENAQPDEEDSAGSGQELAHDRDRE